MDKVNILNYVPSQVRESPQIIERCRVENPEFEYEYSQIDKWKYNWSPETADEDGISIWEDILKITPDSRKNLEDRRAEVILELNEDVPFTLIRLHQILYSFVGVDNYELTVEGCRLFLTLKMRSFLQFISFYQFLERMVPLNVELHLKQIFIEATRVNIGAFLKLGLTIYVYPKAESEIVSKAETRIGALLQSGMTFVVSPKQE